MAEILPAGGGGSGRGERGEPPPARGDTLRARSDLYARLPAVLRTRSGGPLEVRPPDIKPYSLMCKGPPPPQQHLCLHVAAVRLQAS